MSDLVTPRSAVCAARHLPQMVAETVELELTPSGLRGACPFHLDATRGLYVHDARFHCFSCGANGDVIDWWMRLHEVDEAAATAHFARGVPGDSIDEHGKKPY